MRTSTDEESEMGRQIDKAARTDQVVDAALALFLEAPRDAVTFEAIAERAGLNYWQVYRFHGNARTLFRAAVSRLVQGNGAGPGAPPPAWPPGRGGGRPLTPPPARNHPGEGPAPTALLPYPAPA